ncbi:hypothetical protein BV22DRAFT_696211 [Leucogyrophana mollusca]|uniref:Uncharacterized protein n=1 Tax=Leucogyrophana mollusca TaxID=85980 RepID=A0ACB8B8H5_9AGAM|nr:hypothetical protein BV22DRAFT_696211 [Leucogyrophana mollusca]
MHFHRGKLQTTHLPTIMSLNAQERLALKALPVAAQGWAERAIGDSLEHLGKLSSAIPHLKQHLDVLVPVFHIHLDPSRVPKKIEQGVVNNIMLAKLSIISIACMCSLNAAVDDELFEEALASKSHVHLPWLLFFHHHFLLQPSDTYSSMAGLSVTKGEAVAVVQQALISSCEAQHLAEPATNQHFGTFSHGLKKILAQLWCIVINLKHDVSLADDVGRNVVMSLRTTVFAFVLNGLALPTAGCSPFIDLVGGQAPMASISLKHVRQLAGQARNLCTLQPVDELEAETAQIAAAFQHCMNIMVLCSRQDPSIREELISIGSISVVVTALSQIWPRVLVEIPGRQRRFYPPYEQPMAGLTFRRTGLYGGYRYVSLALVCADDDVSSVCEALRFRILDAILQTGVLASEGVEPKGRDDEDLEILRILPRFFIYDRVVTATAMSLERISSRGLEKHAQRDVQLWKCWTYFKDVAHAHINLQKKAKATTAPSDRCSGPDAMPSSGGYPATSPVLGVSDCLVLL